MEPDDKRVWRCRICRMEMTPRFPVCRVVIGLGETEKGQCANPLPIRGVALAVFLVPIPIQVFLGYAVFRLRRVPVQIGHHIGDNF